MVVCAGRNWCYWIWSTIYKELSKLILHGKGNIQRTVPCPSGLGGRSWQTEGTNVLGLDSRNRGKQLTDQAVYAMLQKRARLAGANNLSPYDFRRTFVADLSDAGADIATVHKMAGHASPATTSRYERRAKRAQHKAASLLHVPYKKRSHERND